MSETSVSKQRSKSKDYRKNYQKHYRQTIKGKARRKSAAKRYRQSEKGKVAHKRGEQQYKLNFPDRVKAQSVVNKAIQAGKLPRPNSLKCHYCPVQANQYHHWHGYAPEHWLDIIPVCVKCHKQHP